MTIDEIAHEMGKKYPEIRKSSWETLVVEILQLALEGYDPDLDNESRYNVLIETYEKFVANMNYKDSKIAIKDSFYFLSGYFDVSLK